MNKVVEILKSKRYVYERDLVSTIGQLRDLKQEMAKDPTNAPKIHMQKYPALQSELISKKVVIQVLLELEKEIEELQVKP